MDGVFWHLLWERVPGRNPAPFLLCAGEWPELTFAQSQFDPGISSFLVLRACCEPEQVN